MRRLPHPLAIAAVLIALGAAESHAALTDLLCVRGATSRRVERAARFTPRENLSLADRVTGARTLPTDLPKSRRVRPSSRPDPGTGIDTLPTGTVTVTVTAP